MTAGALWWRRDRRWVPAAALAVVGVLLGLALTTGDGGLARTVGAEAGFGLAAAALVAVGVGLRRAWLGRADDDLDHRAAYSPGVPVALTPTGSWRHGPIAVVARGPGAVRVARLRREVLHPDEPDGELAPGRPVALVGVRIGEAFLHLQHRQVPDDDLAVRLVDQRGDVRAGAHRGPADGGWTVVGAATTLRFAVPVDPRRRPARRTLHEDGSGRALLLRHRRRRRMPEVVLDAPADLDDVTVVLCLWLAHLLDAHAAAGEPWQAPSEVWTLVPDDFPSFVGPGGFGRTWTLPPGGSRYDRAVR